MSTQNSNPPVGNSAATPAVPAMPMTVNGSGTKDHKRAPSMTVTPAGTTSFNANGPPQNKANVQFGQLNSGATSPLPTMVNPQLTQTPTAGGLGPNSNNLRMGSPSASPSPIPQPSVMTGGRPPSSMDGPQNGMKFGQFNNEQPDVNGMTRSLSGMNMDHTRRASQHSAHGNGPHDAPAGPGRGGYSGRGNRGGYSGNNYNNSHMNFNPNNAGFRPNNSQNSYRGRGGHMNFPNSPSMQNRQMHPGNTPTMQQMQMAPGMPYGGGQYHSYPVNTNFPSQLVEHPAARGAPNAVRGKPNRGRDGGSMRKAKKRGGKQQSAATVFSQDPASDSYAGPLASQNPASASLPRHGFMVPALPLSFPVVPDLSPASGNFEQMHKDMLTSQKAAYGQVPIQADPSIQYSAAQQYPQGYYPAQYQQGPPQSPRYQYNQPGFGGQGMQPQYSNQGAPMSRNSSQVSHIDRPGSRVGETPQTPSATLHGSARAPSVSSKENFQLPKKSTGIVIKNAAGEVVDFSGKKKDVATPVIAASSPAIATSTPPSRTGSAVSAAHNRSESQSVKPTDQEQDAKKKAMQEAVARKIAEAKEAEEEVERKAKQAAEEKAAQEAEAKADAERKEAASKAEAERKEQEAKDAAEKAKAEEEEKNKPALTEEEEMERMIAEMEAEEAAREAEEARREEEYQKKKAAQKEAQAKKEAEEAAAYEATMKEAERAAEEAELAKEKKRAEGDAADDEARKMFAQLKGETVDSNDVSGAATPVENNSGTNTPVSESSAMGPPKTLGSTRRGKPEQLTLNTKAQTEPPEPSATLKSLTSARRLEDPSKVDYPDGIVSPNPALNQNAPADRKFKYNKEFLLQFQEVFKEKPSLDWDQKIREALGHDDSARPQTARTPSGMGGRIPSQRGASQGGFQMGNFAPPSRQLPPGTTSEQRFAASNAMRGGPLGGNPFAMGRQPSMGPLGARNPSNSPLGLPGSTRIGGASRGGSRAESKRNKHSAKAEADQNKSMPLTAGMNVGTLEVSSTGWKARSVGATPQQTANVGLDGYMEADVVQRKVKAALNKMTPEKFERISDQVLEIAAQSKQESDGRTLRQVIQLVFEKATDEAHWASMYAKFCLKMLSTMSAEIKDEGIKDKNGTVVTGGNLFRKYLLNRCQEEFEKGWKVDLPTGKDGESQEAVMLSDEYYTAMAAKRRGLGLVKFIGELFKLGMLTERIMHECVKKLLDYEGTPDEAEVESLSSLLRTIGKQLDSPESKAAGRMDAYFERITATMNLPDLPSRLRFMLLDIIDLRKAGWDSKDADKGPKTIQQIHEEAEATKAREEMARLASQANNRGGRMPMGRGDARSVSGYGGPPPPDNNRVGVDDLRRLGGVRNRTSTPSGQFGPSGLGARTNSGRRGLGPNIRADDSANTSRTGTPPAAAKKDESSTNAFSALAALEGADGPTSPNLNPSSPPVAKTQPAVERERSRSPEKKENA